MAHVDAQLPSSPGVGPSIPGLNFSGLAPLSLALDSLDDGIFIIGESSGFQFVNQKACRMLGYSRSELLELRITDIDPGFPENYWGKHWATIKNGKPFTIESRHRTKDGRLIPVEINSSHLICDGQDFHLAIAKDITERKHALKALQDAQEFNKRVVDSAQEGIIVLDPNGCYLVWNAYMERMSGVPARDVLGKPCLEVFPFLEDSGLIQGIGKVLGGEALGETEFKFQVPGSAAFRWTVHTMSMLPDSEGRPVGVVITTRDITERKRADLEYAQMEAQLLQTQKMECLGNLAGGIAHDMNNVLAAILAIASGNLGTQPTDSPVYQAFDTICRAATRGGKVVQGLLSFARQNQLEEQDLDLNSVVQDVVHLLEYGILSTVSLELSLACGLRPIRGDGNALTHALMNLCVNSVDAMAQNGRLTLRTRNLDEGLVEVSVEDTGSGMTRAVFERALEPFFTTKPVGKGTGLGLSMVYSTVKAHRGRMEILSEPGQGTSVRLRFPADEAALQRILAGTEPQPENAH